MECKGSGWKSKVSHIVLPPKLLIGGVRKRLCSIVPTYERLQKKYQYKPGERVFFPMLAETIQREDMEDLKQIFKIPLEMVEFVDADTGISLLHLASTRGNKIMWMFLSTQPLFHKFKDKPDLRGTTPLIAACWYQNRVAVKTLIQLGADPRLPVMDTKKTALHVCAEQDSEEICKLVLSDWRCAEVINDTDSEGNTPLMLSVMNASPCSMILLQNGADYSVLNPLNGRHVLHLAVLFSNYTMLSYFTETIEDFDFFNVLDINEDSPMSLALTIRDVYSMENLLESKNGKKLVYSCQRSLHALVEENRLGMLEDLCHYVADPDFYDVFDEKGRTPLLLAIELERTPFIRLFCKINVNFETRNKYTGDTVLHVAANTQNKNLIELIFSSIPNRGKLSAMENNAGLTAYEIILTSSTYEVWKKWITCGQVDNLYENSSEESSLYIAAKGGNYVLVLALLLSRRFSLYFDLKKTIEESELLDLELKAGVYASDVFIALGLDSEKRGWKTSPNQGHLFQTNAKGMNIFHACALGGSRDCLRFLYHYCKIFKNIEWQIDASDDSGSTPLFYAILNGATDVASSLLSYGCDMSRTNVLGWSPIHAMAADQQFDLVLAEALGNSVHVNISEDAVDRVLLSFRIIQSEKERQMDVVGALYENLHNPKHIPILISPVIEYFLLYKWSKIKYLVRFRLLLYVLLVFFHTMYLSLKLCTSLRVNQEFIFAFRCLAIATSLMTMYSSIPMLFFRKAHYTLFLLAPLSAFCYLCSEETTRKGIELAALSVLLTWFVMIAGSHSTRLNYQISVLLQIIKAVMKLLPVCIIVITAFSLCFFTLFHDYFIYNNPLRSFFTISIHLREGEATIPVIPSIEPMKPMDSKKGSIFYDENFNTKTIKENVEIRDILIEGSMFLLYKFVVIICTFNLLVEAGIKGVTELAGEEKFQKFKNFTQELVYWEVVLNSKLYVLLNRFKMSWIFGIKHNLREELRIPPEINPLTNPLADFDPAELRWRSVGHSVKKNENKCFKYMWEHEMNEAQNMRTTYLNIRLSDSIPK